MSRAYFPFQTTLHVNPRVCLSTHFLINMDEYGTQANPTGCFVDVASTDVHPENALTGGRGRHIDGKRRQRGRRSHEVGSGDAARGSQSAGPENREGLPLWKRRRTAGKWRMGRLFGFQCRGPSAVCWSTSVRKSISAI